MSDTPRTQKVIDDFADSLAVKPSIGHPTPLPNLQPIFDFARQLERELAAFKRSNERIIADYNALLRDEKSARCDISVAYKTNERLERDLAAAQSALHQCYAATGEEAGGADDFRAMQDRERITVEAVAQMRKDLDAAQGAQDRWAWRYEALSVERTALRDTLAAAEAELAALREDKARLIETLSNLADEGFRYSEGDETKELIGRAKEAQRALDAARKEAK